MVAFSGGGDSLALLLATKTWADRCGRRAFAVTVDHRLHAAGAQWAAWCADRAARLGLSHSTLVWGGQKPTTGLPAAARDARHRLIADAAREVGATVVLMGHTADDRLEAARMRQDGASVPDPRVWSPSPTWPQGRGMFILRPMLDLRRAALRDALAQCGEIWIDDPANADPTQSRARARAATAADHAVALTVDNLACAALFDHLLEGPGGDLAIRADCVARASPAAAKTFMGAALLCAAGTTRPPRGMRLDRVLSLIASGTPFVATLVGARVQSDGAVVQITRDPGEFARRGLADQPIANGRPTVFDGRFEITAWRDGLRVGPLRGRAARLPKTDRDRLKTMAPAARAATPVVISRDGGIGCALFADSAEVQVRRLTLPRLAAALRVINCESDVSRVAKTVGTS